jgi:hypothetical protein
MIKPGKIRLDYVVMGASADRTYVGMYSMVIVSEFRATFWSCWPLKEEKAATLSTAMVAAIMQAADFIVFCLVESTAAVVPIIVFRWLDPLVLLHHY